MAILPDKNLLDGSKDPKTSVPDMRTAMGTLRDFLAGLLGTDSTDKAAARAALQAEAALGNPDTDGKVLSSTAAGERSWVAQGGAFTNDELTDYTVGGLPTNYDLDGKSYQQVLELMVYGNPQITSGSLLESVLEVGDTLATSNQLSFTLQNSAEFTADTLSFFEDTAGTNQTIFSGGALSPSPRAVTLNDISRSTAGNIGYRITATSSEGAETYNFNVAHRWRVYWGTNSATSLTEAQIEALASSELKAAIAGNYSFAAAAGTYKYICCELGMTISNVTLNGLLFPMSEIGQVSVTNAYGQTATYRVYRSGEITGGAMTLEVS